MLWLQIRIDCETEADNIRLSLYCRRNRKSCGTHILQTLEITHYTCDLTCQQDGYISLYLPQPSKNINSNVMSRAKQTLSCIILLIPWNDQSSSDCCVANNICFCIVLKNPQYYILRIKKECDCRVLILSFMNWNLGETFNQYLPKWNVQKQFWYTE